MLTSINFILLFIAGLFPAMLLLMEIGRRLALRHRAAHPEVKTAGLGAIEGALFALLGLLIAFTFSGAGERFEARRRLVVEEANAIGTAYLRLDLLPAATQPAIREMFRGYVDSRLAVYRAIPDLEAVKRELAGSALLQKRIWSHAVSACGELPASYGCMLVLPALNEMIDITTARTVAAQAHPPAVIYAMLVILCLACALLAGYGMGVEYTRSWLHAVGFAAMLTLSIYVIIDYEFPRVGLIRLDPVDQVLIDVRHDID